VLRKASASVNRIDTSDFYCPHATNQIIREALHSYPDDLVIATKVGARRGRDASVHPAMSREDLTQAVYDNPRNLSMWLRWSRASKRLLASRHTTRTPAPGARSAGASEAEPDKPHLKTGTVSVSILQPCFRWHRE